MNDVDDVDDVDGASDPRDRLLEVGLDEVLGGRRPPDLSARILERWAAMDGAASTAPDAPDAPEAPDARVARDAQIAPEAPATRTTPATLAHPGRRLGFWLGVAAAATVLLGLRLVLRAPSSHTGPTAHVEIVVDAGALAWSRGATVVRLPLREPKTLELRIRDRLTAGDDGSTSRIRGFGQLILQPRTELEIRDMEWKDFSTGATLGALTVAVLGGGAMWASGAFSQSVSAGEVARLGAEAAPISQDVAALSKRIQDLEEQVRVERARNESLASNAERRAVTPPPPTGDADKPAPPIESTAMPARFVHFGLEEALANIDWDATGSAVHAMVPLILELVKTLEETEEMPLELIGEVQALNAHLLKAAAALDKAKVPGTGVNGAYTHPVVTANLVHAALAKSGTPLTAQQQDALAAVASRAAATDDQRRSNENAETSKLASLLAEVDLKERFLDEARGVLTPEQLEAVMPSRSRGKIGTDIFSAGLVLAQHLSPIEASNRTEFGTKLASSLGSQLKLDPANAAKVEAMAAEFATAIPDASWQSMTATGATSRFVDVGSLREIAHKQLQMTQRMLRELDLTPEQRKQLLASQRIVLPRGSG